MHVYVVWFFKRRVSVFFNLTSRSTEQRPVGGRQGTRADPSHAPYHLVCRLDKCVGADVSRPKDGQTVSKDTENVTTCYFQFCFSVFNFNHPEMNDFLKICENN
jgi:hypothetical protein